VTVPVLALARGLAASSGVVAAWVITALILLLLAAVFWSFLRRSGTLQTLEVDRLDQRPVEERIDDATTEGGADSVGDPAADRPTDAGIGGPDRTEPQG
jgi:hypothetical protein